MPGPPGIHHPACWCLAADVLDLCPPRVLAFSLFPKCPCLSFFMSYNALKFVFYSGFHAGNEVAFGCHRSHFSFNHTAYLETRWHSEDIPETRRFQFLPLLFPYAFSQTKIHPQAHKHTKTPSWPYHVNEMFTSVLSRTLARIISHLNITTDCHQLSSYDLISVVMTEHPHQHTETQNKVSGRVVTGIFMSRVLG